MLINSLKCTVQLCTKKNYPAQSIVPKFRNSVLEDIEKLLNKCTHLQIYKITLDYLPK